MNPTTPGGPGRYTPTDTLHLWWLQDPARPRLVGLLRHMRRAGTQPAGVSLAYASSWLADGMALSEDLPLLPGEFLPNEADSAAGAVDDARPDRWGERVIRLLDRPPRLSTLEYLYFAGDERFGALGVSTSADDYLPRTHGALPALHDVPTLHDLVRRVEAGEPVAEPMRRLVAPGTTLGGAKPKALLTMNGAQWVLKFGEAGEPTDSPLVEHATMTLAMRAGITVCETHPIRLHDGHALAVRRFDRAPGLRVHALSAHVALRAAGQPYGYPELALLLRRRAPADTFAQQGEQLFRRMVFNILIDNTDDHEKNHALGVAGFTAAGARGTPGVAQGWYLSPAFDVLPSGQALGYQQMRVGRDGSESTLANALSECRSFALTPEQAQRIARTVAKVVDGWKRHFAASGVTKRDLALLAEQIDRPFLRDQRRG